MSASNIRELRQLKAVKNLCQVWHLGLLLTGGNRVECSALMVTLVSCERCLCSLYCDKAPMPLVI